MRRWNRSAKWAFALFGAMQLDLSNFQCIAIVLMDETDDAALVTRCLKGETGAFEKILERYQKPVFNIAFRMLHDYEDARDICQIVFVKAHDTLESFNPEYRFFSWIYRIAVNESLNLIKKKKAFLHTLRRWAADRQVRGPERSDRELSPNLRGALMKLRPEHRAVIVLKHLSEYGYRDLSEILGIPEKTVKSRLFEARRALKAYLSSEKS